MGIMRVVLASDFASEDNPSAFSAHPFRDHLAYFIDKLDNYSGLEEVVHWSAVPDEWMLDITDVAMFLARYFSRKVHMWRLCAALENPGPSEVIEYPNGIDVAPGLAGAPVCAIFSPVFLHGVNSGHIVPAVRD